jgi:hypothetical protein
MKSRFLAAAALAITCFAILPASADQVADVVGAPNRYAPKPAGTFEHLRYVFGPYTIPPGQDSNRITADLPLATGFASKVAPNLIDAKTGKAPSMFDAHIHHAHWFRVTNDSSYEKYTDVGGSGLSWVFGTGEERTQGSFDWRALFDPRNADIRAQYPQTPANTDDFASKLHVRYGIYNDGTTPQALIYMIHNKTAGPLVTYVTLDVDFTHGTAAEIKAATGQTMEDITGILFGTTQDAVFPARPSLIASTDPNTTFRSSGTILAMGSHLHPGGKQVTLANLGPRGTCTADADHDGFPGTTIFVSKKYDYDMRSWPYSEDYEMGGTKFGFRAPIHAGDVIRQFGDYALDPSPAADPRFHSADGLRHAWWQAMSYTGVYYNPHLAPAAIVGDVCDSANYLPTLNGTDAVGVQSIDFLDHSDPRQATGHEYEPGVLAGIETRAWDHRAPTCGVSGAPSCTGAAASPLVAPDAQVVDTVHITGFIYTPGDLTQQAGLMGIPKVKLGTTLRLINDDAMLNIRHTFTTCPAPCSGDGPYHYSNYPLPDGKFDTGKLGNIDPIDGGVTGSDTVPVYDLNLATHGITSPGIVTYFCRIHPWMRGAFEAVA